MNQQRINPLEILAFRRLSPQDKKLLQKNHPDLYTYLQNLSESRLDHKTFTQLYRYSTQCKPNKIPNLTKKELIACLYRKLPYLNEIKRRGGMQYKQFLSSFLSILRFKKGTLVHTNNTVFDTQNFLYGNIDNPGPVNLSVPPWAGGYYELNVRYSPHKTEHVTVYDYVTVQDFIKMVKILYPKFHDPNYINDLVSKCNRAEHTNLHRVSQTGQYKLNGKIVTPDTIVISLAKLYTFLMYIGAKFAKEVYTNESLNRTLTPAEQFFYSKDFKFSYDQINRFMLAIPKEVYVDFLLNSDARDTR